MAKLIILEEERRFIYDYQNGLQLIYLGKAHPNIKTSESGWQIRKYTYALGRISRVDFANGTSFYDKIWDSRATYDYTPDS